MVEPGPWTRVPTDDGSWTLAHPEHGEACHSTSGARLESHQRYVAGCALPERWAAARGRTWRVLDIGTGLGWNLAATLEARQESRLTPLPALELVTLEVSREVLEASFALHEAIPQGPSLGAVHAALKICLKAARGTQVSVVSGVSLSLYLGAAEEVIPTLKGLPPFDVFYLDPFSPRREPGLWTPAFLQGLAALAAPEARLATYCAATHVRVGLALAGWEVGPGPRVGQKAEGTLATWGVPMEPFEPRIARRIARRVAEARAADPATDATN